MGDIGPTWCRPSEHLLSVLFSVCSSALQQPAPTQPGLKDMVIVTRIIVHMADTPARGGRVDQGPLALALVQRRVVYRNHLAHHERSARAVRRAPVPTRRPPPSTEMQHVQ